MIKLLPEVFQVLQRLGHGAQGSVYLVQDKRDDVKYVLKKVHTFVEYCLNMTMSAEVH